MSKMYVLMVGINDYSKKIGKLRGCINDVDGYYDYVTSTHKKKNLRIEVLKDADATRENIIDQFRNHLCQAGSDDVVLFQYSGHGASWKSAHEFVDFYPEGWDETIICYNSRQGDVYDLADKEIAMLLSEVARNGPHLAVVLDCCHSGSGTRGADDLNNPRCRQSHSVEDPRPLESYLDGYYQELLDNSGRLSIPRSKHLLLAACTRWQKAWETKKHTGAFSAALIESLRRSNGDINYADLFVRCRAIIRDTTENQEPQFEAFEHFNAHSGFLGGRATHGAPRYSVHHEKAGWSIDCGAIHGLPTDAANPVSLALYRESDQDALAGHGTASAVGAQKSDLELEFESDDNERYRAEITSLPVPPTPVFVSGDKAGKDAVYAALDDSIGAAFVDKKGRASYGITAKDDTLLLNDLDNGELILGVRGSGEAAASQLLGSLRSVLRWKRLLAVQNPSSQLDAPDVGFWYSACQENGEEFDFKTSDITLDYDGENDLRGYIRFRNGTDLYLHAALFYFSSNYGIHCICNETVSPSGDRSAILTGDGPEDVFFLDEGDDESVERFRLFVTTERVDAFLLAQDELAAGKILPVARAYGAVKKREKLSNRNQWFTRAIDIKVVRQSHQVGSGDASVAGGQITIKAHPTVTANISLSSAKQGRRSAGAESSFWKAIEQIRATDDAEQPYELLDLAGTRGTEQNVLELWNFENAGGLADNPLQIELNVPLADDEHILPLTFDGEHVLIAGQCQRTDDGKAIIEVSEVPPCYSNRRSLTGSLKLYFFKTYLRRRDVNQLRWVKYGSDGSYEYRTSNLNDEVARASNILLLVHGITGDTRGMAESLPDIELADGTSLRDKFDLVLTFDYENLATPIEETADDLRLKLDECGLHANDDKRLTFIVHSMGGLVSRWYIEQLGGNKVVDHLVMCGTPNGGSPFGEIESARVSITALTLVALNLVPVMAPLLHGILAVIQRSRNVTPCLEQMHPESDFIKRLNAEDQQKGIPYTILAGDISEFEDDTDRVLATLLEKVGKGDLMESLFGTPAHDIAVSQASIRSVSESRSPQPQKHDVACHHLNYFTSGAGQEALALVDW